VFKHCLQARNCPFMAIIITLITVTYLIGNAGLFLLQGC
jgi:hypothetical protein